MTKTTALILILSFLMACGNSKVNFGRPLGPVPYTGPFTISGSSIVALPNGVQVSVTGDQVFDVLVNGSTFTIGEDFYLDESLILAVTPPNDTYSCTISPTTIVVTANISDIVITCDQLLQGIYGSLTVYETGGPTGTLEASLYSDDTSQFTFVKTETADSFGNFVIPLDATGDYSVMVVAENYVPNGTLVSVTDLTAIPRANMTMLQLDGGNTIDVDAGGILSDQLGTSIVEIAASSLETVTNSVASGTISSQFRIIDASSDSAILPGNYMSFDPVNFNRGYIETYGADFARFKNNAGDNLDLISGQSSTVRVPIAQSIISPVATAPLFYFDETSSLWIQSGSGTLVTVNGEDYYEASVSDHKVWSAGEAINTIQINGCVNDSLDQPIANATVISKGSNYISSSSVTTNASGQFSIPVKQNAEVFIFATSGAQSNTITQQTGSSDISLAECLIIGANSATMNLTWSAEPRDLDSHWVGPADDASAIFHIDYTNRTQTVSGVAIDLDVDDTSGFGPEIITMPDFPFAGTYRYAVHHFAGSSNIAASGTRVELNLNGQRRVFTPSTTVDTNGSTDTWVVFEIVVDAVGNSTVNEINNYINLNDLEIGIATASTGSNGQTKTLRYETEPRIKW